MSVTSVREITDCSNTYGIYYTRGSCGCMIKVGNMLTNDNNAVVWVTLLEYSEVIGHDWAGHTMLLCVTQVRMPRFWRS